MECGAKVIELKSGARPVRITCSRCSLGELCLPRSLNEHETTQLEEIVERSRPYHGGELLFRAGDSFRTIAAVRSGCFKSFLINEEGEEQVLDFHLPGEIVGLDAIHSGTHLSSCVALDTAAVCGLCFGSLSDLARSIPALQNELFDIMSQRISELGITSGDYTADQRFALFLESLSRRYSRRGYSAKEFTLAMSRRDIANYLHLATETVSRILSRMKENGILEVRRKQIRICDSDALHAIGQGLSN
ncbi:MAG TPA: fumarate/nitrate reduction transcriptional regulator Fnr [Xanthomonadales bacterium]|nr:fumarate/nitrate reduction transcriptional regulator Fnr [Xanthomonadales bacterium]